MSDIVERLRTIAKYLPEQRSIFKEAASEIERLRAELESSNSNHREMAKLLAETGRERDGLRAALHPFATATLTAAGDIVGLMRDDFVSAKSAYDASALLPARSGG